MASTLEHAPGVDVETPIRSKAVAVVESDAGSLAAFASQNNFMAAQRIARALSASSLVPSQYQGDAGLPNCLVAMELASRTGASVLMVMQNLYVIKGRPSWSAAFLIASVNTCGRFSPIRYEWRGQQGSPDWSCRAVARDLRSGDVLEGEWITWDMVKNEGWLSKNDSKWKTMPGQMFRYRAASWWARAYAPEISLGMHSADEIDDIATYETVEARPAAPSNGHTNGHAVGTESLRAKLAERAPLSTAAPQADESPSAPADPVAAPAESAAAPIDLKAAGRVCDLCAGVDGKHKKGCTFVDD